MVNDTISDLLTRVRNANLTRKETVSVPLTSLTQRVCEILKTEGLIGSFQVSSQQKLKLRLKYKGRNSRPCITNLRRISKPGLRVYINHEEIPKVLGGMGVVILSTPQGLMADREARFRGVGGEVLCSVW